MPMPTPPPRPDDLTPPKPIPSKPDEGGFQLNEQYEEQLIDISSDFATAIVSASEGLMAKPKILDDLAVLTEHDFSDTISSLEKLSNLSNEMTEEASAMSLEFEALVTALNNLDEFIIKRLYGLNNDTMMNSIMDEYNKYKEGRISFSEFLKNLEDNKEIDNAAVFALFGFDINSDDYKTIIAEFGKKSLEQVLIDLSVTNYISKLGLNLAIDSYAYGFSQGVAYSISSAMFDSLKNAAGRIDSGYLDLNKFLKNPFGGFFVNALIVSTVNIGLHKIKGDLDDETLFRAGLDGFAIAGSSALGNATSAAILAEGGVINSILISAGLNPETWAPLAAAGVVAFTYWGGSELIDYAADQIWTYDNTNFNHDRLIAELAEDGALLYDTNTIPSTNENAIQSYVRMDQNDAPRAFTNYFLGAAGQQYDTSYDGSPEFDAITDIIMDPNPAGYSADERNINAAASRYKTLEERQRYIETYNATCDYMKNNEDLNIESYLVPGANDYALKGTLTIY